MKRNVVRSLVSLGARKSLPLLLNELSHRDREVRHVAYSGVSGLVLEVPGFDAEASKFDREKQVLKIREWVESQREK